MAKTKTDPRDVAQKAVDAAERRNKTAQTRLAKAKAALGEAEREATAAEADLKYKSDNPALQPDPTAVQTSDPAASAGQTQQYGNAAVTA